MWEAEIAALRMVRTNGIDLRVCDMGSGSLVVLVHGWPEGWYSWRHQIRALVDAGYRVLAPDMRGYGGSSCPNDVDAYAMRTMAADIAGLIETVGEERAVVVGHDWGAMIAWHTALLGPAKTRAVVGMSVPYTGRAPQPPLDLWRSVYKDRFFYQLYFLEPGRAEADFSADIEAALFKVYCAWRGGAFGLMAEAGTDAALLDLMPEPDGFPDWLSEADLAYMADQFRQSGFHGGFNRYRVQNTDWHDLAELKGATIDMPSLFIAGDKDPVLKMVPGVDMLEVQKRFLTDCRGAYLVEGAGHWVQQQKPGEVTGHLLGFLGTL